MKNHAVDASPHICRQIEGHDSAADVAGRTLPWPRRDSAILEYWSPQ